MAAYDDHRGQFFYHSLSCPLDGVMTLGRCFISDARLMLALCLNEALSMENLIKYSGIMASVWIVLGIYVASLFYPNYSHVRQFCSELGAVGSPTQKLSPVINNYPLGVLFILFGYYLITAVLVSVVTIIIGVMVVIHGLCTLICGLFPMDIDPYTKKPSTICKIHYWSGTVMFLSFVLAPALLVFSDVYPLVLRLFSFVCIFGCCFFSYKLTQSFRRKTIPGLYQRLSYGFQILWLLVYSFFIVSQS